MEHLSVAKVRSYCANGAEVGVGGVSPPAGGDRGLPKENFGVGNALRVGFRLS